MSEPHPSSAPRGALGLAIERFRAVDSPTAFQLVRLALGDDAAVLRTTVDRGAPMSERVEVAAIAAEALDRFRARLTPASLPAPGAPARRGAAARPLVLALVGPSGAGKTTALAKLATNARALGDRRVGLLAIDARRPGAIEQLHAYATAARLPLEVASEAIEVPGALRRLSRCDVILVDTPGRGPRDLALAGRCDEILRVLAPDEVHLVLPGALRPDLLPVVRQTFAGARPTHALLARLDEVPGDHGVAELADALGLPVRWATDGPAVPADLVAGPARVLAALGAAVTVPPAAAGATTASAAALPDAAPLRLEPSAAPPPRRRRPLFGDRTPRDTRSA